MANIPPRRDQAITSAGVLTRRFAEFLEGLTRSVTSFESTAPPQESVSAFYSIQNQIGSGDPLTSDETGFTVDSDMLSVDMVEA